LSFVADGTLAGSGATSNLEQVFSSQMPTGNWRLEVLRAFQSWVVNANVNVGVVSDGGQAMGSPGQLEGDPRFGDFRVAGQPLGSGSLSGDSLANETPFRLNGTTWAGDLVFNTGVPFGIGDSSSFYDVFSVALHEAGHAFGLGDNSDPTSAMFSNYAGVRSGPSAADVLDLQSLYGVRQP